MYEHEIKFDLQLFADEEDEMNEETSQDDFDIEEFDIGEEEGGQKLFTQEEVNRIIQKRLERANKGTLPETELQAIKEIEQLTGLKIGEVGNKLKEIMANQSYQQPNFQPVQPALTAQQGFDPLHAVYAYIPRIEEVYRKTVFQELRDKYTKENGYVVPFSDVEDEVLRRARALGISNYEIIYGEVLREKLPQYLEQFQQNVESKTLSNVTKRKKTTEGPPAVQGGEISLTKEQIEVAKKLGISPRDYYEYMEKE